MKTKTSCSLHLLKYAALLPAVGVLLAGCATSSKEGQLAAAGLVWEQRGESTTKVDGQQLADVIKQASSAFTVAGQASAAVDVLKGVVTSTDTKATDAKEKAAAAAAAAAAADKNATAATNDATAAKEKAKEAKAESEAAKETAAKLYAELGITKEQLATAQKAIAQFDVAIQDKLRTITADQVRSIAELKNDREKFDKKVEDTLKDHKLTDAEIKEFQEKTKGMTTNEILAILATGVGAAGAGSALARRGPSRGQAQIDKNTEALNELKHTTVKKQG